MKLNIFYCAVFFLLIVMNQPVSAAGSKCSYNKSVQQNGTLFNISSREASGCAVQIIKVTAVKRGKKIATLKADVDYLPKSAQAVDLDGDGTPELVIISRPTEGVMTEALDVYWLEGKNLRRSMVPPLEEKKGYKGGDRYRLEGNQMVRTIPLYNDNDSAGKPTGGTRTLKYKFKEGAWALIDHVVKGADASPDSAAVQSAPQAAPAPPTEAAPFARVTAGLAINGIRASDTGIEISANRAVMKYKIMRLDKPERIAIDIPGAESQLTGKKVAINRFGINSVKVGRQNKFLRIVLVSSLNKFPKYEVKPSAAGLRIEFTQ